MARGKKKSYKTRYNIQFFLNKAQRRQHLEAHCFFIPTALMRRDVPKTSLPSPVLECVSE
ncbi:MAG TPA: hypothetical protein VMW40_03620 [Candidatus Bathyarchaeia archaeon]|nr:hypothetical protein [Candidatus Bathyarchaeia archaeon]